MTSDIVGSAMQEDTGLKLEKEFVLKWRIASGAAGYIIAEFTSTAVSQVQISSTDLVRGGFPFGHVQFDGKDFYCWLFLRSQPDRRTIRKDGSGIDVLGPEAGSRIRIAVQGPDAKAVMEALTELLTVGERVDHCVEPDCPSPPFLSSLELHKIAYACSHGHSWEVPRRREAQVSAESHYWLTVES